MQSAYRTKSPTKFTSQLLGFSRALQENREDITKNLHKLIDNFRQANQKDFQQASFILQEIITGMPSKNSPASPIVRDFFMAISSLFKVFTSDSLKPQEFEKNKNAALEVFEEEFSQASQLHMHQAYSSSSSASSTTQNPKINTPEERKIYFSGKNEEIAIFLAQQQPGNIDQLIGYLIACQQFENELEFAFFPDTEQKEVSATPLPIQAICQYDVAKFDRMLTTRSDFIPENFINFLSEYNLSLSNSCLLIEKLILVLEDKRKNTEVFLLKELEDLKGKTNKTYFLSKKLLNVTEEMKAWSLQFFHNPRRCSSIQISIDSPCDIEKGNNEVSNVNNNAQNFETTLSLSTKMIQSREVKKQIQEEMTFYREQASQFNSLYELYLQELKSLEELSKLSGPGSTLEQYKQRAVTQEKTMTAIQTTSTLTLQRWEKWQQEMIKYFNYSTESRSSVLWQPTNKSHSASTSSNQMEKK